MVEAFLARSKAASLSIQICFESDKFLHRSTRNIDKVANFALVLKHMHRVRNLEITCQSLVTGDGFFSTIETALTIPAPRLESFHVYAEHETFFGIPFPLPTISSPFAGEAPLLKSLCLINIEIPWKSTLLRGLTEIHFSRSFGSSWSKTTLQNLLFVLSNCPNLKELELESLEFSEEGIADSSEFKVNLPHLRRFHLLSVETSVCRRLLDCLELGSVVDWDIRCDSELPDIPIIVAVVPHLSSQKMNCEKLHITLRNITIALETITKAGLGGNNINVPTKLTLQLDDMENAFSPIGTLTEACIWRNAECVRVEAGYGLMQVIEKESWATLFDSLPQLRFLTIILPEDPQPLL